MNNIDFFKQQSKKLLKDVKLKLQFILEGRSGYKPQFFTDVEEIMDNFNVKDDFSLMNAQHVIAKLAGFYNWSELIKANDEVLELGKLLFINRQAYQEEQQYFTNLESLLVADWKSYEKENLNGFDDKTKLEVFKKVFLNNDSKNKSNVITLDFSKEDNAQDMLVKIMRKKELSPEKAILHSVNQSNCISIINAGYADIALSFWGHDDPYAPKEKLDNPIVKIKLNKAKEYLVSVIMQKEDVSLKIAILYFMLFELAKLGYHI